MISINVVLAGRTRLEICGSVRGFTRDGGPWLDGGNASPKLTGSQLIEGVFNTFLTMTFQPERDDGVSINLTRTVPRTHFFKLPSLL
ncbi:MAG TPA: hypothetical protein VJS85_07735 [Rhizomicrobium sp.]|nr:hypothetical protein [Rhizomicrobium sp.]